MEQLQLSQIAERRGDWADNRVIEQHQNNQRGALA
jgi:hypothetical protein